MTTGDSRIELVYGEGSEGLIFLQKEYALDFAGFREALSKAFTWGELRARVGAKVP
jgi:hypothetical protein